jgi:two-component system OmpR family sensor kinase
MSRIVRPWRRWTLRSRMVVAVAALAAAALVATSFVGATLLRSYLLGRIDTQLQGRSSVLTRTADAPQYAGRPRGRMGFGPDSLVYLYRADGTPTYQPTTTPDGRPRLGAFSSISGHAGQGPYTVDGSTDRWRVMVTALPSGGGYVVDAVSIGEIDAIEDQLLLINAAVTALVLVGIAFAAAAVVRIGLRPLHRMEGIAAEIASGDLTRRVDDADPHTESGRLGAALNTMLGRIESAIADRSRSERRLRQFLADASHELRTPLTSIQGFTELYRRGGAEPGPQLDDAMRRVEAEVGRMRVLVNDLLLLARLDEERPIERQEVDLLAVAADAVRDAHFRVPSRFVQLTGLAGDDGAFEPVTVLGDESRIRQVVMNLLVNALQHTGDDARVVLRVGRYVGPDQPAEAQEPAAAQNAPEVPIATVGSMPATPAFDSSIAVVEVADTGPGLRTEDAEHAFERLYRADHSRSRQHGGAGLGLAIVAAIVQAHGGRVELYTAPGEGARFRVLLPARPPEALEPINSQPALR